jgi:hypothetical protein
MAKEGHLLHSYEARAVSARIERDTPKMGLLTIGLVDGDYLAVTVSRVSLERLRHQIDRAIREAPLPARGR